MRACISVLSTLGAFPSSTTLPSNFNLFSSLFPSVAYNFNYDLLDTPLSNINLYRSSRTVSHTRPSHVTSSSFNFNLCHASQGVASRRQAASGKSGASLARRVLSCVPAGRGNYLPCAFIL